MIPTVGLAGECTPGSSHSAGTAGLALSYGHDISDRPKGDAVAAAEITCAVNVTPKAGTDEVRGLVTGDDGAQEVKVRVTAAPENGKANKAVCKLIASSLGIVAEGYLLGTAAALVLGLALGFGARSSRATEKVVSFLSAIPPIVYIPYGIALLPTFRASSVLVIFLATLWPVLTGTLAGVSNVDERILNSARVLNVGRAKMLARVVLPSALPLIFNGLNIALCLSFILLTSAEMIGGSVGMGYYVKCYSDFGDYTRILAGIIVIGVVITFISTLLNGLQRYLTRWK
ncbi:MAG: DUF167 domain-containing protein [Eggerthellaceae bacterium]|nr:DUF167 domain-containing protein [Eggerthellaceae bacterium]